ncbi:MAG TPA: NAD(P)-binding domain-containing protein [Thermoanaerobaculia bacterium]|jgi:putative flavoprotein involved in K+ transport
MRDTIVEEGAALRALLERLERESSEQRAGADEGALAGADYRRHAHRTAPAAATRGETERVEVLVIGAGQAGLSVGYHLKRRGVSFLILDSQQRIGDTWRRRWDSLRLFTPARFDALDGMPFPGDPDRFPTKDEMADYLASYAERFAMPVRSGVRVDRLSREGDRYVAIADGRRYEAAHVVVAMASYQRPRVPDFARALDPGILQIHSSDYHRLSQLRPGAVLVVGAGNSGAEIAIEAVREHETWMSGRDVGQVPFRIHGLAARLFLARLVFRVLFHRILTLGTAIGRRVAPVMHAKGGPLIRTRSDDLAAAGVRRVPRVAGVKNGKPLLDDGRVLDVANVVWCTGFHPGFSWIDLPVFDAHREPIQDRGVTRGEPGLYFVGLFFLYALSSTMIHGVGRDAEHVAEVIASRRRSRTAA